MFELRTEFAAAKDFKTTLLCILISLHIKRKVNSVKYCEAKTKDLIFVTNADQTFLFLSNLRFAIVFVSAPVYWVDEGVDTAVAHGQPEKEFFKYVFSRLRSVNPPVWKQEEQVDVLELVDRGHDQSHSEVGLQIQGVFLK